MIVSCYVAAPWGHRLHAKQAKEQLEAAGFVVTSSWIEKHADKPGDSSGLDFDPILLKEEATEDAQDVHKADIFILLNTQKRGEETSGKAVECGMAMAWGKPVILVGEPTNIFHFLDVQKVSDVQGAIDVINKWITEYEENTNPILLAADIEALIAKRDAARNSGDIALANKIYEHLQKNGVLLEDQETGTEWRRV